MGKYADWKFVSGLDADVRQALQEINRCEGELDKNASPEGIALMFRRAGQLLENAASIAYDAADCLGKDGKLPDDYVH